MILYLDTSSLVKLYVDEIGSTEVRRLVEQAEIVAALQEWRVPVGSVPTMDRVFESEQLRARNWFASLDHPTAGPITFPGPPFRMSESPWGLYRSPLTLGQHNREIYGGWLGLDEPAIGRLYERGII